MLAAALLLAPGAPLPDDEPPCLDLCADTPARVELQTLIFPRDPPVRLLRAQLRISGIDPEDVRRTLEAYNRAPSSPSSRPTAWRWRRTSCSGRCT